VEEKQKIHRQEKPENIARNISTKRIRSPVQQSLLVQQSSKLSRIVVLLPRGEIGGIVKGGKEERNGSDVGSEVTNGTAEGDRYDVINNVGVEVGRKEGKPDGIIDGGAADPVNSRNDPLQFLKWVNSKELYKIGFANFAEVGYGEYSFTREKKEREKLKSDDNETKSILRKCIISDAAIGIPSCLKYLP
jgi:hypothetical protein